MKTLPAGTVLPRFLPWGVRAEAQGPGTGGQWTMPGKDYAATRFSSLAQITPANAARLKPVWTFSTGVLRGHEGQPLVVGRRSTSSPRSPTFSTPST